MHMLKKILFCLLAMTFVFATCSAARPQRVAILPVYFHSSQDGGDVGEVIEKALTNKFHTPLAGVVPVYAIIPREEIVPALPIVPAGGKAGLDKGALAALAEKLKADIVIAAEVSHYYSYASVALNGDRFRQTNIEIRVLSYHKPLGEFTDNKDRDYYNGDDTLWAQPDYIAGQIIAGLLAKVPDYR